MDSTEFRKAVAKEEAKIQRLKQERERIDSELKGSLQLVSIYERGLKQAEKVEKESEKKMKKIEEELAASLASMKQAAQYIAPDEVFNAGDN